MSKVAIIGCGYVGSTAAYAMFIKGLAEEIALIDVAKEKAEGEAMDLEHGLFFKPGTKILYGSDYELCKGAEVVIVTAGKGQKPGQTRLDLVKDNSKIIAGITKSVIKHAPEAVILMVTNPVDIMTYVALKESGFPNGRVFGTGTTLDTARFRYYLGQHYKMSPESVHAYILGEHGDSEFPVWSLANIAGLNLECFDEHNKEALHKAFDKTKKAAYEIIAKKGATYYAIGLVIADIVDAIIHDSDRIYPVSTYLENYYDEGNLCISTPCVIGRGGIKRVIQLPLDEEEQQMLHKSAKIIKDTIKEVQ